jgi:hypothetical protein
MKTFMHRMTPVMPMDERDHAMGASGRSLAVVGGPKARRGAELSHGS